jgi:hypothetical protein
MRGDRYGTIVGHGRKRQYIDSRGSTFEARPYLVKLDVSGKTVRVHPDNVFDAS